MVCSEQRVLQQCIHLPAISYAYYLLTGNNDHSPVSHTLAGSGSFESDELARQRVPDAADSPPEGSARTPLKPTGPNIISIVRACARICMHALCIRLVFVWCFFLFVPRFCVHAHDGRRADMITGRSRADAGRNLVGRKNAASSERGRYHMNYIYIVYIMYI